jgi:hypothetical protein
MTKEATEDAVTESTTRRSRRELLTGAAAGAAGAIGALALTRPATAYAATDSNDVVLGGYNAETSVTTIVNNNGAINAFAGTATGGGTGVAGASDSGLGVSGFSTNYQGVFGQGTAEGVYGQSGGSASSFPTRNGVHGVTDSPFDAAVWGENLSTSDGVHGSTNSSSASGVYGENAGTGYGIAGRCDGGTGASGYSANGVGVVATSPNGTALSVNGTATFSRSGSVSIAYPAKSATVTVPGGLSASALVLALMQNSVSGVWVASAVPNTSSGKATINLNKAPGSGTAPKTANVAWFVVD